MVYAGGEFTTSPKSISADVNLGLLRARRLSANGAIHVRGLGVVYVPSYHIYDWTTVNLPGCDPDAKSTVLVIDDDPDLRASIGRLLRSLDLDARLFASVSDFLKSDLPDGPACLVLDVRLPGQSGLDFQRELVGANTQLPIIFITGHGDIPMSVQAMKGGAIEFLTKPFRDQELLDAIQLGLHRDRARREN